jgi:uncharacterized protein (DUF2249 family)
MEGMTMISAERTVNEIKERPGAMATLQRLGVNHCCGGHLTLREAAAAAGIEVDALVGALRDGADEPLAARSRVLLDVRDDIARGEEPFARIMAAVKALGPDDVLELRAPFEPLPLYEVLRRRGWAHRTDRHAADDWSVCFYREPATAAGGDHASTATTPAARTTSIDVRGLEPPQPMVAVLEALDGMGAADRLEVIHSRRPVFLYPQLDERGFVHETDEPEPGVVRIVIRRRPA